MRRILWSSAIGVAAIAIAASVAILILAGAPSSDRDWAPDQAVQPRVRLISRLVRIDGVRDFRHAPGGAVDERYRSESFDIFDVRKVWFVLAPFANAWTGLAHTFVSFELGDGRFVAISVEARRERNESYTILRGLTRRFEMTYVVGTEPDLLGLRALRGDMLYLYPSRATPAQSQAMLVDMLRRSEALRLSPEFYNTLTNNCATNLRRHVNRVATEPLPLGWAILFPGYSDELALKRGLLATDLPLEAARQRYRVDEKIREALAAGTLNFSREIRAGM